MVGLPCFSDGETISEIPSIENYEYPIDLPVRSELPYSIENRIGDIGLGVEIVDDCDIKANETVGTTVHSFGNL